MKKTDEVYTKDIQRAIEKIERFTKDVDFEQFRQEDMRSEAVIRQLEIIGEATNKLSDEFLQIHKNFPTREAISLRNFLIHNYDDIDLEVIWKTIKEDIPLLKEKINSI